MKAFLDRIEKRISPRVGMALLALFLGAVFICGDLRAKEGDQSAAEAIANDPGMDLLLNLLQEGPDREVRRGIVALATERWTGEHQVTSGELRRSGKNDGLMTAHYIDVGDAEATLLTGPDFTVLIDAADCRVALGFMPDHMRNQGQYESRLVTYLKSLGIDRIDLLIGTHSHHDHMNSFPRVLEAFDVKQVWLPGSRAFMGRRVKHLRRMVEETERLIAERKIAYREPRAGEKIAIGSLAVEVVHPEKLLGEYPTGRQVNYDSVSIRATYGKIHFLFTGDASRTAEREMVARGHDLRAHILHLGHHGANDATDPAFLAAVMPEVAIYSAHAQSRVKPGHRTLHDLFTRSITVYGTDVHGNILIRTDGEQYAVEFGHDLVRPPVLPSWRNSAPGVKAERTRKL